MLRRGESESRSIHRSGASITLGPRDRWIRVASDFRGSREVFIYQPIGRRSYHAQRYPPFDTESVISESAEKREKSRNVWRRCSCVVANSKSRLLRVAVDIIYVCKSASSTFLLKTRVKTQISIVPFGCYLRIFPSVLSHVTQLELIFTFTAFGLISLSLIIQYNTYTIIARKIKPFIIHLT